MFKTSQSITFCLFTDAGKCRAGSEVRRFRISRFEFDLHFAVVDCPKQLCRYLREKISQQKIQISTITKGVPITKIEVAINKRRTILVKINVPQIQAAKVMILTRCERRREAAHDLQTESSQKSRQLNEKTHKFKWTC